MTEIKFYHNAPDRLRAACAITGKAVAQGLRVLAYAPDETLARRYDHLLWVARPLSFIPHVAASSPLAERTPVLITTSLAQPATNDVLLNLGPENLEDLSGFKLLVEIVSQDPADRQASRQKWKFYKERGYSITAYDLAKTTDP